MNRRAFFQALAGAPAQRNPHRGGSTPSMDIRGQFYRDFLSPKDTFHFGKEFTLFVHSGSTRKLFEPFIDAEQVLIHFEIER